MRLARHLSTIGLAISLALVACGCGGGGGGGDPVATSAWPRFHQNNRNTARSAADTSADTGTVVWDFSQPNDVFGSPVIGGDGTIYVSAGVPSTGNSKLYAVNPDGSEKWEFERQGEASDPIIGPDGTIYVGIDFFYALNPDGTEKWHSEDVEPGVNGVFMVATDGTIYLLDSTGSSLSAVNPDGSTKWVFSPASGETLEGGAVAIAPDGTIYAFTAGDSGTLYAVNPDGTQKWSSSAFVNAGSRAAIGTDGTIYFEGFDGSLHAFNPDGTDRLTVSINPGVSGNPSIGADDTIYVTSYLTKALSAIRPDGTVKWSFGKDNWGSAADAAISADGTIYTDVINYTDPVNDVGNGLLYALNPDGSTKWSVSIGQDGGGGSPAIGADGTIYVSASGADLFAVH